MTFDSRAIPRRQPRFQITTDITVSGIDKEGHYFSTSGQVLNGSTEGMGILLDRELFPFTSLVISVPRDHRTFQIQSEVRHVTPSGKGQNLVGVRFRKTTLI
ncbi:MAG: PilZ domain-containing protein [Acidobacteriota bacterium]